MYLLLLPVLLVLALLYDAARALARRRGRLAGVRVLLFVGNYLRCGLVGLGAAAWLWLRWGIRGERHRQRFLDGCFRLQSWWGNALARGGERLFRLTLRVERLDATQPGPILLLLRHASIADTMLAIRVVSAPTGLVLRYVLKRELLVDPCLDIVGHWLPNYFADRSGRDREGESAAVGELARELGPGDGVLIYPEGTRFSAAKRARTIARLRASGDTERAQRAEALRHVLLPRSGGVLALLERNAANPGPADIVVCAHAGFEGSATFRSLLRGELVGRTITIRFWRVPFAELPADRVGRERWLHEQWRAVDRFVAEHQTPDPDVAAARGRER